MKFTLTPYSGHSIYICRRLCFMFLAHTRRWNILMWFRKKLLWKQKQVFFFLTTRREMSDSFGIEMMRRVLIEFYDKNLLPCCKVTTFTRFFSFKIFYFIDIFLGQKNPFFQSSFSMNIFFLSIEKLPSSL